jgi:iron complex outermembrane receptor protein
MPRSARAVLVLATLLTMTGGALAQTSSPDLRLATLEELMKIEITSASRREQRAEEVPAAVYVIGRDEIRRSGLTSVPELLRLAPGVQVARINSNKWAVSVRGFNSLYSNKLLVMVDGRSIYNPAFSAVLWDTEDLMVEDIDHIEIIRGPGGAMWGANAVNGVINIITRGSGETRGGVVQIGSGTFDTSSAAFRYGGSAREVNYRLFAQGSAYGDSVAEPGGRANDNWRSVTGGFRTDWTDRRDALMVQGSATSGRQRPLWLDLAGSPDDAGTGPNAVSRTNVANVLGRWTRTTAAGASFQAQAYFDHAYRSEAIGVYNRRTWDIDAQYHTTLGARHDLVAGGGYRHIAEVMRGRGGYTFTPDVIRPRILNAFAQDTISMLGRRVEVTLGAKFENNTFAGSGFQPNARLLWTVTPSQRVWTSVSRALRTPSLIDRGLHVEYPLAAMGRAARLQVGGPPAAGDLPGSPFPVLVGAVGNPDFSNEHLLDAEAGYRLNLGSLWSVDVVGYWGRYDDLQTYEPQAPFVDIIDGVPHVKILTRYENLMRADTRGAEVSTRMQLAEGWRIDGAFSAFHLTPHPNGSLDPSVPGYQGHAPAYQWRAHLAMPIFARGQGDVHVFHTGKVEPIDVPAFARLDVRVEWSLTGQLAVVASGQNLLRASHVEFYGHETNIQSTRVPRSGGLRLVWRF